MWRSVRAQGLRLVRCLVGVFDFSRERRGRCTTSSLHPTHQHCVYGDPALLLALVITPPPQAPSDDYVPPSRLAKIIIPATHETQLPSTAKGRTNNYCDNSHPAHTPNYNCSCEPTTCFDTPSLHINSGSCNRPARSIFKLPARTNRRFRAQ